MFHEKLKENRMLLGLSQEQLADKLAVSHQTVSKWETGVSMPDLENIVKLSELFEVSIDYLLKNRKLDSDYSYYTVVQQDKKTKSPFTLLGILAFVLSFLAFLTLFVVSIIEPLVYVNGSGKEIRGFIAYCYIYPEFFVGIILLTIVLILALLAIFIPDKKLTKIFK